MGFSKDRFGVRHSELLPLGSAPNVRVKEVEMKAFWITGLALASMAFQQRRERS